MLTFAAGHLRSSVARNALACIQDVLNAPYELSVSNMTHLVAILLRCASDDKKFLRQAAHAALEQLVEHHCTPVLIDLFFKSAQHPNALVQESVARYTAKGLSKVNLIDVLHMQGFAELSTCKSAEGRQIAKRALKMILKTLGVCNQSILD